MIIQDSSKKEDYLGPDLQEKILRLSYHKVYLKTILR